MQVINNFIARELSSVITVLDSHVDLMSPDVFGQVTGGWIRVRGTLHPALLYPSDSYNWDLKYNLVLPHTGMELYSMPDVDPETTDFSRRAMRNPIIQADRSRELEELLDSFKVKESFVFWYERPLYLLPVVSDAQRRGTFGIVLEPVASKRGTYKRWGWFEEAVSPWNQSSPDVLYGDKRTRKKLYLKNTHQELKIL